MNTCTFCGRLVADGELKESESGTPVLKIRVASDVGWGENKKTHWVGGVLFGKRAQALAPHIHKGEHVTVSGTLEPPRMYEAQGETRVAQDMVVQEIALQGGGQGGNASQRPQSGAQGSSQGQGGADAYRAASGGSQGGSGGGGAQAGSNGFSDEIPFHAMCSTLF